MSRFIKPILVACLSLFISLQSSVLFAAPAADLWERWSKYNPDSTQTIDHSLWDDILKRYVVFDKSGVNLFAYAKLRDSHRAQLDNYLSSLAKIPISSYNRDEQLAYWINLYNALTIDIVLNEYPLQSIKEISGRLFASGPWDNKVFGVEREKLSLNDIEHRILRPIWRDPRIHYAVNCASYGCPNLQPDAFTASQNEALLDRAAREFINHKRAARVGYGNLKVSSIYGWYQKDFGGDEAGVIQHLRQYAKPDLKEKLKNIKKIEDYHYDWALNDASKPETRPRKGRLVGS